MDRLLRGLLTFAFAVILVLATATPAGAIVINWRILTDDITRLVPPVLQPSLLAKVDAAMADSDRGALCPATTTLGALRNELIGLGSGQSIGDPNDIGDPTLRTLLADVDAVLAQFPPDPCLPAQR